MGNLNQTLITAIRNMQNARTRTVKEIQRIYSRDMYTDDFKLAEAERLVEELRAEAAGQTRQAAQAFESKIAELDSAEQRAAELRAMDSDYLNRLNLKMENLERLLHKRIAADGSVVMDNFSETMRNQMKAYFAEFKDDPIAVGIILERLGSRGVAIAPEDNTGKRQQHLRAVHNVFNVVAKKTVGVAGPHGVSECQDVDTVVKGEEDAFIGYCGMQNEDFSLDDDELLETAGKKALSDAQNTVLSTDDDAVIVTVNRKAREAKLGFEGILWKLQIANNRKGADRPADPFETPTGVLGAVFTESNAYGGEKLAPMTQEQEEEEEED